ncbi:preprotein translocase subunit SecY [Candidatus Saccharibacteria bacterium]|nr:preprotein translocase subunit SecY [Candidatus Saccharibacteria bacterium]MCB9821539.1 preprotein translocase subunit SecY [Candidatus Nomurabacteria bacterium]
MNWKLLARGFKNADMRKRIFAVIGMMIVFRILAHVPIPLAEPVQLKQILNNLLNDQNAPQLLSFLNVLSGGALASLSIMLVGLGPYINASIIMQVLGKAIPKLENLQKEGEFGRRKINQYTRILTFPLAIIQSIGAIYLVRQVAGNAGGFGDVIAQASMSQWVLMISALTGGAMVLMWLGELITEKSIGNGISLLITVGIVSQLPFIFSTLFKELIDKSASYSIFGLFDLPINGTWLLITLGVVISTLLITIFVVYLNEAQRPVKISYAKKIQGNRTYGDVSTVLPVKLVTAGVIPIIFAVAFLSVPQLVGRLLVGSTLATDLSLTHWQSVGHKLVEWFSTPGSATATGVADWTAFNTYIYPLTYLLLVMVFTYFYTNIVFNAKEISEQLQRQGGFIADIRPGKDTEKYLSKLVNRLNLFGAMSLGFLALTPIIAQGLIGTSKLAIGGTSILILVAVALETMRQLESKALMLTYDDYDRNLGPTEKNDETTKTSKNFGSFTKKLFTKK